MRKIIIVAGLTIAMSSTAGAQNQTQNNHKPKEQDKTTLQQNDNNSKKASENANRKMKKSKKNEDKKDELKMDNYESTKQRTTGTPAEQRHMDSTINKFR